MRVKVGVIWLTLLTFFINLDTYSQESRELAIDNPEAIVDLRTNQGIKLLKTSWKYSDVDIVEDSFGAPGPSTEDPLYLYPTGKDQGTWNIAPKAGAADFDDSSWEILDPNSLEERRCPGKLCFNWYRLNLTIPQKIDGFDPTGSTIVFEIVIDDYSEIWVNGKLNKTFGQSGNGIIKGFNARNRIFLTNDAQPGDTFQLAILGINGPLADIPDNYIWIRSATVDFYKEYGVNKDWQNLGNIITIQPELSEVINPDTKIEKIAEGFQFTEGPVWHPDGYLLFSDPNTNVIYKYDPLSMNVSVYITKSGYSGTDIGNYHQPGSNGLAIDNKGRLIVCQHGNRRIIRHEKKGPITVLADSFQGKKLDSPNDVVIRSDGAIFFTDPPYGLPKNYNDPSKEMAVNGVYSIIDNRVKQVATDLGGPNGIAFSPDEKYLYVSNWDIRDIHNTKTIWRYEVASDGTLSDGKEFFNMNQTDDEEALDGLKVDLNGNIFSSAPGGVWIISPEGKYLGKIIGPERPANMAWGDDGKTLYLTAHSGLYKIRTINGGKISKR